MSCEWTEIQQGLGETKQHEKPPAHQVSIIGDQVIGGKICSSCHTVTSDDANFCPNCGQAFPKTKACGDCQAQMKEEAKFCPKCGMRQP